MLCVVYLVETEMCEISFNFYLWQKTTDKTAMASAMNRHDDDT